ncbi:hypothetical protein CU098_001128, partial [Rhizopus stolonifer]
KVIIGSEDLKDKSRPEIVEFSESYFSYLIKLCKKADGCVIDEYDNEIFFLEVSGRFLLRDRYKYDCDHIMYFLCLDALQLPSKKSKSYAKNVLALEELDNILSAIKQMKKEHEQYKVVNILGEVDRQPMSMMVNSGLKRPVTGVGFGLLLMKKSGAK